MATEGLNFVISGDNKALIDALQQSQRAINDVISQIENGGKQIDSEMNRMADGIDGAFKKIAQAAGGIFAVSKAKEFLSEIVDVRKEFQSLELSFATLTGDANKGKKLFSDITKFATSTPMLEKDLAKGAQTLLGFNIEAEKIMPILKQIGDISMGDSQKFESLTLSFAQASSTGKLMGQDLLQMINAGFNPLVEISRTTGKSISELKDEMSEGKISVEMLQNAFKTATEEGGKFHGMLNGMANGLEGSFSNLEGAFQKLFNDLGQEIEGPIVEGANLATEAVNGLAENLETVGNVIGGLVATFGVYKTACLAVTAVHAAQTAGIGAMTTAQMAHRVQILLTQKAQALLNATMLANPYVAVATALAAVAAGLYIYANRATGAEQAQKGLNDAIAEQKQAEEDRNTAVQKAISLASDANKADTERKQGIQTLVSEYGSIIEKYIDEEGHLTNIIALKKEIALLDGKKTVSELQGQSKQYAEYARLAELALNENRQPSMGALESAKYNQNRKPLTKAERAALNKAMAQYADKTGGSDTDYSRAASYFSTMAKGTANQAGTTATQANVNSFAASIGAMSNKQLQKWQGVLKNAQTLAKSGSLVNIQGITRGATSDQINGLLTQINGALNARSNSKVDKDKKKEVADIKSKIVGSDVSEAIAKLQELQKKSTKGSDLYKYYDVEIRKLQLKQQKAGETLENQAERQAAAREKLQEELTALERKNQEDENNTLEEGLDKKLAILKSAHEEEIEELQKQATDWARENKKAKMSGATASASLGDSSYAGLTAAQVAALQNSQSVSDKAYDKAVKEARKQLIQSQIDYLKGAKNVYERHQGNLMDLQNQRELIDPNDTYALLANLRDIDNENTHFADELVEMNLNIEAVWQNFENLSEQALRGLKEQLSYAVENGVNGKKISEELKKELEDKLSQIEVQLQTGGTKGGLFGDGKFFGSGGIGGGSWVSDIGQNVKKVNDAETKARIANAKWEADKQKLAQAQQNQSELSDQYNAAKDVGNAQKAEELQKQLTAAQAATQAASTSAASSGAAAGSAGAAAGAASGVGSAAITEAIIKGVNQNVQSFAEASKYLWDEDSDAYKGVQKFAESSQYAVAGFDSLKNGDLVGTIMNVGLAFSSLGESLGIWSNSNFDDWQDRNEELIDSQKVLTNAIEHLSDKMEEQTAGQAYTTLQSMQRNAQVADETAREQMINNAGLYNGGHSMNSDFWDNGWARQATTKLYQQLYKATGNSSYLKMNNGLSELLSISATDLEKLYQSEEGTAAIREVVRRMREAADDGNYGAQGDMAQDWLDYIDSYGESYYDQFTDKFYETVNGLSFDSFKNNFLSMMMDLESEVDDFADSFNEQLTQSVMNDYLKSSGYNDKIEELYRKWGEAMQNREALQKSGTWEYILTALQQEEADISAELIALRDSVASATGYDANESQKASRSSIENITQDQADQLIGRITAIQIAVETNNASMQSQSQNALNSYNVLMSMNNSMSLANSNLSDILMQHVQSNSYLADIVKYQRGIYEEMEGRIEKMSNKLDTL